MWVIPRVVACDLNHFTVAAAKQAPFQQTGTICIRAHNLSIACLACRVQHEYLAAYITELALPEYSALQWLPSIIAAAAVLLARHICAINIPIMRSLQPWSSTLQHYSGYRCAVKC